MEILIFDLYLLITRNKNNLFGIIIIKTNDIFILGNNVFIKLKYIKLKKTKLIIKFIKSLTRNILIIFNKYKLIINRNNFNIILL